ESRDLCLQLAGEVSGKRCQHNPRCHTIDRGWGLGQSNGSMNEDNGLASACSPGQSERTVVPTLSPAPLFGVEEDSPRLEVSAFGHALELVFVLNFGEAQLRGRSTQAGDECIVFALFRSSRQC